VAALETGQTIGLSEPGSEHIVVPLAGHFSVEHSEGGRNRTVLLAGRPSVFAGLTDVLYLSAGTSATVSGEGRFAVVSSPTGIVRPSRRIAAEDIPVEMRGAGASSRQVHNFGMPGTLDAARLLACEVITPSGNWSSYPPHKHDEHRPGEETRLEEIYYFEAAPSGASSTPAMSGAHGFFSAYSSPAGDISIDTIVRTGDIVLVPHGYHGPAAAPPGYDLYYLNVMAGPDPERRWLATDDPSHGWVRSTWEQQQIDPRLPLGNSQKETQ
jgi:5-deoxy-glucuronate isomerase